MKYDRLTMSTPPWVMPASQNQTTTADLTPMLDTIFLIILLLLATLMHSSIVRGFPVNCPGFAEASTLQKENQALEVSVDKDGQLYIGKDPVADATLPAALQQQAQMYPAQKVLLRGDREAPYGEVAHALARVSRILPDKHVILVTQLNQSQTPKRN